MNKNLHRVIFNTRRGQRMAVAETAASTGKSASGENPGHPGESRGRWSKFALTAGVVLLLQAGLIASVAMAQVIADPTAPGNQQATVLQTANGVTQVNIQTPSAAGVSRNTYSQFDVTQKGVILNNGRTDSSTQLGGFVQSNPWLTSTSARVILNEINSSNPSYLNGYVEVAGQRAEVIIANPAGISVNGGGFLNASGVTLTTGAPVVNGGNLEFYRVRGGQVAIEGAGLDTSTADYTNILARAAQLNAGVWAKDLKVVTGLNQISASNVANPAVTGSAGPATDTAPTVALDVSQLGGMYAGKIFLVGTEAGLGVRNSGVIGATAGDVTVNHDGWLTSSGTVYAKNNVNVTTQGDVTNSGALTADNTVDLRAQNLNNTVDGTISAQTTKLVLTSTLTNRGTVDGGNLAGTGQTQIDAATVHNLGTGVIYGDTISIATTTLNNTAEVVGGVSKAGTIAARQRLDIGATTLNNLGGASLLSLGDIAIGGSLDANRQATGSATTVTNSASTVEAMQALRITSAEIHNLNPLLLWEKDAGTPGVSGTLYLTNGGTFDSHDGAVLSATGPLVGQSHGGYAYQNAQLVSCGSFISEMSNMPAGCSSPTDMTTVYTYVKGAAAPNSSAGAYSFDGFVQYAQTDYTAVVTQSTPGRLASGGDMTLQASVGIVNDQSSIVAGGALNITSPVVDNRARTISLDSVRTGTAFNWSRYDHGCGNVKGCDYDYMAYRPSSYTGTIAKTAVLDTSVSQSLSPDAPTGQTTPAASTGPSLPSSSLFRIQSDANANYLVATDPRFTNYRAWLSSDYITGQIALDPTVTQKRLGDGFYEQQLIREQIANLTGKRFLGNYTSDQQAYQALMDAGVTYAKDYDLRPGIALSAAQIARLTSDIVWLQQTTVTLADGSTTQALVPHVYLAIKDGDLSPSGALLGGNTVNITAADLNNSGTLLGRQVVQINANTINNINGQMQGKRVLLDAAQDINNIGGRVEAEDLLAITAGRDINLQSTTSQGTGRGGNYSTSQEGIDRVAGLYVTGGNGTLLASAGNDINLLAAQMESAGSAQLSAGNTVNLGTLTKSQSNNFGAGSAEHHLLTSQTSDVGSTVKAGQDLTITAGQDIIAKAANLQAQGDVNIAALGNVVLNAGQTRSSLDMADRASSSSWLSTTTTSTQTQASAATAQVSTVQGKNVSVIANQNLVSVGTQFKGTQSVYAEGKDTSAFYAATNVQQSTTTTQSTTTLSGLGAALVFGLPVEGFKLEDTTATDSLASSTAIGTRLISDQKIEIGVGNKTELQGATLEAQQIAFTKTDPNKQGELILGGSTNTTQTSHTEKTETAGLYQEMKGHGSTIETLNQTSLKGNVSFDAALKITAQIPDTQGGQALKSQINALATQGNGVGLDYLNQLANNSNVKWDQIALANENWSYEQAGLTPAGAALVSIAMAVVTGPGAASFASGLTTSSALSTAMAAGMTSLTSQAAVAMINNKGDIGKTLEQLGSEQSIKGLLTTMVTAGALDKLNSTMGWNSVNAQSTFTQQFQKNLTNNLATDMVNSALAGKPFDEKTFANSLQSALINTGMAQGANEIGNAYSGQQSVLPDLNDFTHKLAHAVLGCAAGAATAGNGSGCGPGAVGAVVGELTAEYAKKNGLSDTQALGLAKIIAATSGVITGGGGDNADAVNISATTGANAAENNFLGHIAKAELKRLREKQQDGQTLTKAEATQLVMLAVSDQISDDLLARYRKGDTLGGDEQKNLQIYLKAYAEQNGVDAMRSLVANGVPKPLLYPYASSSQAQIDFMGTQPFMEKWLGVPQTTESKGFEDAKQLAGWKNVSNNELTPTQLAYHEKYDALFTRLDSLINSPVLATGTYLTGLAIGADPSKVDAATQAMSQLSDVASSLVVSRVGLSPVLGKTTVDPSLVTGVAVPSGFANANDFSAFGANVRTGLARAGFADVEPILQGSAVTGMSFSSGSAFDAGRVSDFDMALASPSLLQRATELGIGLRSGGTRTGPLSARDLQVLGLTDIATQLSKQTGREVNFMIYQSTADALQRAPSLTPPKEGQ